MEQPTSKFRKGVRMVVGGFAALVVLYYATVTLRPNRVVPIQRSHEERGRKLGLVEASGKVVPSAKPPAPLPPGTQPFWAAPEHDRWLMLNSGVAMLPIAAATYTFREGSEEEPGLRAVKSRSYFHPVMFDSWKVARPDWADNAENYEEHRAGLEALLGQLAAKALDPAATLDLYEAAALPTVVAWLAHHDKPEDARKVLDRYLACELADPHLYLGGWGAVVERDAQMAPPSSPLLSTMESNPIASAALLLDQTDADPAFLEQIATALEKDIPSRDKIVWMLDQEQLARFAAGEASLPDAVAAARPSSWRSIAGGDAIESTIRALEFPLLRSYYRASFAAWMRGDVSAAVGGAMRYQLLARSMNLSSNEANAALDFPPTKELAKWYRTLMTPQERPERIEAARFMVAALRFHRAKDRWPSGLEELVPEWLAPGLVGTDGARWGVMDLAEYEVPIVPATQGWRASSADSFDGPAGLLWAHLAQEGEPPKSLADLGVPAGTPTRREPGRPLFWWVGPAAISSPYLFARVMPSPQTNPEDQRAAKEVLSVLLRELPAPDNPWREARAYMQVNIPDPAALKLLKPRGT